MDRETYVLLAKLQQKVPPKPETPKGQKFHIGEIVRISNPQSWYSKRYKKSDLFEIEYSYAQKYGGSYDKNYSLRHLFEDKSSSWYHESELELVKGITEINDERDKKEYERLKLKFGV